ncbi:MAG: hypothetical protein B7733_18255 [Myxococcales bacterium FL481]|nr:MAG: hypothetical protein B7733_18255 [Myxococcales bacterium FL481]
MSGVRPVRTVPAILSPLTAVWGEVRSLFSVPLAFIGGFLGTIIVCAGAVALVFWAPNFALASGEEEDDEFELEFQPGALVRLGKKLDEKDLPEKIIVQETYVEEQAVTEALTKDDKKQPDPEPKKKDETTKKPKNKPSKKKTGKKSDHEQKSNNPWNDLPTVDQLPGDPFGDPAGWSDMVKEGDPWATSVMKALNNMRVPSWAAQSKQGQYGFKLKICKDGRVDQVLQKQSSGNAELDGAVRAELLKLQIPRPPASVIKQMKGSCVTLKYTFIWRAGRVK